MFTNAVLPNTVGALKLVSKIPVVTRAYLAGGTALALHIGHRISEDLDFFTQEELDESNVSLALSSIREYSEDGKSWRSVWGKVGTTKLSLFYYKYPLLQKTISFENIQVLDKKDIAAMKINALESRGTKRDFVDVFFLAKEFPLEEMLSFYDQKYACLQEHLYSIIRSLSYFADADNDERSLEMLKPVPWNEVKSFFKKESARLAESKLGL
jgi:predicted nucleotidyltransferase component of viral defense system